MSERTAVVRVLLVDDDEDVAGMYGLQLAAIGYQVITARSGEEALELARTEPPDVIYLDLGLPRMSGLEVLRELRRTEGTAGIPVFVLTNYSEPDLMEQSRALGALQYLIKAHTTPAQLSETARSCVGRD